MAKRAVYPGMFDPIHNGHVDVIQRSLQIFDELIVAVVANPSKAPLFSVSERLEMIDEATPHVGVGHQLPHRRLHGLLIDIVARERATASCAVPGGLRFRYSPDAPKPKCAPPPAVFLMPTRVHVHIVATSRKWPASNAVASMFRRSATAPDREVPTPLSRADRPTKPDGVAIV